MKSERHNKIVELIKKYSIGTQEELADALNKAGFNVTQATVSRDIRELNLTKMSVDGGKQRYVIVHPCTKRGFYLNGYGTEYYCDKDSCGDGYGCMCGT